MPHSKPGIIDAGEPETPVTAAAASTSRSSITREPSAKAISIQPDSDGSISLRAGYSFADYTSSVDDTTTRTKSSAARTSSRCTRRQVKP